MQDILLSFLNGGGLICQFPAGIKPSVEVAECFNLAACLTRPSRPGTLSTLLVLLFLKDKVNVL